MKQNLKVIFLNSPIRRIGWIRFLRNVIIASGNSKDKNLIKAIYYHLNNCNPIIRGSCIWSLSQLLNDKEIRFKGLN